MKKQILVLSIALGMNTMYAQTTKPTDKQKGTEQKGNDQNGTKKGTQQTSEQQNGTQKGTQNSTQKGNQQKGMRQSGSEETGTYNSITPPSTVSNKFNSENPNMDVNWRMDGENYSADFLDKKTSMGRTIIYDKNGNITRTDYEMTADGLNYPSAIGDYHSKNYPNEGYKVWQTDDGKGNKFYYTKRNNGILWFDKDGKFYPGKTVKTEEKVKTTK